MARITLENRHAPDKNGYTLSPITNGQLLIFLQKAIKISPSVGLDPVIMSDDEEGNRFHNLYTIEWTQEIVLIPAGEELGEL